MSEQRKARREAKKLIKEYFYNLDNVYSAAEKIAKAYKRDSIPLVTLKTIINTVKQGIQKGFDGQRED